VLGSEVGADAYVLKPFSVAELSTRVKALPRRSGARRAEEHALTLGNVDIDLERQVVLRRQARAALVPGVRGVALSRGAHRRRRDP